MQDDNSRGVGFLVQNYITIRDS